MNPDYSTYRSQIKNLNPDLSESEIYQMYDAVVHPHRGARTIPYLADDGFYHFIYLTESVDDGRIYVGKHSTRDMNDGYQGSGYEIQDGKSLGRQFKTSALEFFDTSDQAYAAESEIVNENFIRNQKLVMNHVLGGKNIDDDDARKSMVSESKMAEPSIPKFKPLNPDRPTTPMKKRSNWSTFSELGLKYGDYVTLDENPEVKFMVLDDMTVESRAGSAVSLGRAISGLTSVKFKNPLYAVSFNGKNLGKIQQELKARKST